MIGYIRADGTAEWEMMAKIRARDVAVNREVTAAVTDILENVRTNGDAAVRAYSERFDGWAPEAFEISRSDWEAIAAKADPELVASLSRAAEKIRAFHEHEKQDSFVVTQESGVIMGQRVRALARVGLYVPGGTAAYPSSVLMNAVPAKIAGVKEVVMVTPPAKGGGANPDILAAALVAGVDRVFLAGGAQAVAALACGTETFPRVDKIVGPGNIFVATAKKLLYGTVDIDMVAGPSEILVMADETANPAWLAADLMSQAEHDRMASSILLSTDEEVLVKTLAEVEKQMQALSRKDIIAASFEGYGAAVLCRSVEEMVTLANELAPEHLEVAMKNPLEYIGKLDNVGSVFLGQYAPEPLGDYMAGPNHVLPTGGTARFFSPLGVDSFYKRSSFLYYTEEALTGVKDDIIRIANAEGLTAHAHAIAVRFEEQE